MNFIIWIFSFTFVGYCPLDGVANEQTAVYMTIAILWLLKDRKSRPVLLLKVRGAKDKYNHVPISVFSEVNIFFLTYRKLLQ